jgi:hypothetical protein
MTVAAEHAFHFPFLAWFILVAAKLYAAYCAMNNLLFAKDVQAKLLDVLTDTKMYIPIIKACFTPSW